MFLITFNNQENIIWQKYSDSKMYGIPKLKNSCPIKNSLRFDSFCVILIQGQVIFNYKGIWRKNHEDFGIQAKRCTKIKKFGSKEESAIMDFLVFSK